MHILPDKVNSINSQDLLIEFLQTELGWTIPENTNYEDLTNDWDPAKDLSPQQCNNNSEKKYITILLIVSFILKS